MNITRSNWSELYPMMRDTLARADLVSIDFEMTGITASPMLRNSILDSMQVRYWKIRQSTTKFLPLQIGICGFELQGNKVIASPFNVYLYPFTGHQFLEKSYIFDTGAIQFLAGHKFDFNKTFYDGLYYLSHENESLLAGTQYLSEMREQLRRLNTSVDPDMMAFTSVHLPRIRDFLLSETDTSIEVPIVYTKVRNQRYLLFQIDRQQVPYHVTYDSEEIRKRTKMTIHRGYKQSEQPNEPIEEIDSIGLRRIIDQIIQQRTPILFHNGLIDLCQLYDKFLYTLPDTHQEFKAEIQKNFPILYDTKYILNTSNMLCKLTKNDTSLKAAFDSLQEFNQQNPVIEINPEFKEYSLSPSSEQERSFEHEAGYDALMTGYVFFKSVSLIQHGRIGTELFHLDHERLKFHRNRLPMGSVRLPFNLEDSADRYHEEKTELFYLNQVQKTLIPEEEIKQQFQSMGFGNINLFLSYGQNFEYFMTFESRSMTEKFKEMLNQGATVVTIKEKQVVVSVYESYQNQLQRKVKDEFLLKTMATCFEPPIKLKQ